MINLRLSLNDKAKKWFSESIAEMVAIDGKILKEELVYTEMAVQFCQSPEDKDILLEKIKTNDFSPLQDLRDITRQQAIEMLIYLSKTACADGVFSKTEQEHLHECTCRLGFGEEIYDDLLTYCKMRIPFKHDEEDLREKAMQTEPNFIRTISKEK